MKTVRDTQLMVKGPMNVKALVADFQKLFPFLKLEIFYDGKEASMYYPLTRLDKLSSCRKLHDFTIHDELTVREVMNLFWKNMGLQVGIARKLANSNVETAFTSQWTLRQQNKVGSEIFREFE
ncbi:MAG: hypothetical protein ACI9V1_002367 [Spirosomataceae bacterium]|jgi:hypothetical protein